MSDKGYFKVISKTYFSELKVGDTITQSDLAVETEDAILQFKFEGGEDESDKYVIKPGTFMMVASRSSGMKLEHINIGEERLLLDIVNARSILDEANVFFNKLHVYEKLKRAKRRSLLMYSQPGCGKSVTIGSACKSFIDQDPGTVVIIWPTSKIDSDDVNTFLSTGSEYAPECTRLIFVMEDIGGAEYENGGRPRGADSGTLSLLDGSVGAFKLPTLILATTNFPENLLSSLADRPGRFDKMIELLPPVYAERIKLVQFIADRELTEDELIALKRTDCDQFSIAHLNEIVVRSLLHDKTLNQVITELADHKKLVADSFEKSKNGKFGFSGNRGNDFDD